MGWVFAAAGLFAIVASISNWNWFMNHRKAQFLVRLIGRTGTRIFYSVLGTALVVLGVLVLLGIIQDKG